MNLDEFDKYLVVQRVNQMKLCVEKAKVEKELLIAWDEIDRLSHNADKPRIRCEFTFDLKKAGGRHQGYLQKDEVARRLNKSTRWVEIQCKAGIIPYIKIKRSVLFDWDEVVDSLKKYSIGGVVRRY